MVASRAAALTPLLALCDPALPSLQVFEVLRSAITLILLNYAILRIFLGDRAILWSLPSLGLLPWATNSFSTFGRGWLASLVKGL